MRRVLGAILLVGACGSGDLSPSADVRPQLDEPFTLEIDQSAVLSEPAVVITFTAVPHDSRCPLDVVCVWAGDAVVQLTLHVGPPEGDGPDLEVDLHTGQEPRLTPWGPYYELRLVSLSPEPRVRPGPQEPYRATLIMDSH